MPTVEALRQEYEELSRRLSTPGAVPSGEFGRVSQRHAELQEILSVVTHADAARSTVEEYRRAADGTDEDLRALARQELPQAEHALTEAEAAVRHALLPKDPHAGKDVVMEIRAGAGGEEAALFAVSLFKMYSRYAERRGWTTQLISESRTDLGGFREVVFEIQGTGVYGALKNESGVHRVQRIPETEKLGRVHTSTATVAVLPKASEVDVTIRPEDLRVDTYRAGGKGGQHVQKTESAVRITHLATGIVVQCQDERSQQRNKERAMGVLRSRLLAHRLEEQARTHGAARRAQIGTGDRSEKIRTYNMPQNRITDHRIHTSWHNIDAFFDGNLEEAITALQDAEEEALLGTSEAS